MPFKSGCRFLGILLVLLPVAGCKPKASGPAAPPPYFQTSFQDESQFIVEAIVTDLAEQMYYAKNHRLPDGKYFAVIATEKPGSPRDTPVYELQVRLDAKSALKTELPVNGPIWSPAVYRAVAEPLARTIGLTAGNPDRLEDTALLSALADNTAETIEQEDQNLSLALAKDFGNPVLHEKAALLLGAFLLRDHSGHFFEIRSPLCRLTAHLAMAAFLGGTNAAGINGQVAEAVLLTLIGDQTLALGRLQAVGTNEVAALPMVRALRARNTGDYRPLGEAGGLTRVESVEWFMALCDYVSTPVAWPKLNDAQQQTIDFVRVANQEGSSVEIGHQLLAASIPLELQEINSVYQLSHHEKLTRERLVSALNEMPERCLTAAPDGTVRVHVIGWGQWADFLQRHLCHAVQQNFYFMQYMWGVPDEAKTFRAKCDEAFAGLRLYPFVRRFNCTDVETYHQSVDDGFKVTVATPQLVPADCWNWLCYKVKFAPWYNPNPNPHVNEWHNHNPPPGTLYDLNPRLNHPSLTDRADVIARFEQLHRMAPYDCRPANFLFNKKYHEHPTYDQAMGLYGAVLPYSVTALRAVANTVYQQPYQYEKLMLQAATLNPSCYYTLGNYVLRQTNEDDAAMFYDKAAAADPDSVRVANMSVWRVRYCLKKGQIDKAREIAAFAGEVYSYRGLEAEGIFFETTSNYSEAFDWYAKIDERYDDPAPLLFFCTRYRLLTGDQRYEPEVQKRIRKLFPKGIEKVSLGDFQGQPADGVWVKEENDLLKSAGMQKGDIIVAVYGIRVHNFRQYSYARELKNTPELDLIVWHGGAYHESKSSPPDHRFGLDFDDYPPR